MSPCATTVLISFFAQLGGVEDELAVAPTAAAARRRAAETPPAASVESFFPTLFSSDPRARGISLFPVNLKITPEPDDTERAVIEAALAAEEAEKERAGGSNWAKRVEPVPDES
jgi:hypothetical protein